MMAGGMWTATDTGRGILNKLFAAALIAIAAVVVVVAVLIWPALVIAAHVIGAVAVALWEARWWLLLFEAAVVYSWAQDWKEARLRTRSWKHGWLVAHRTVFVRFARRAGWLGGLVTTAVGQLVKTPALDAYAAPQRQGAVVLDLDRAHRDNEAVA